MRRSCTSHLSRVEKELLDRLHRANLPFDAICVWAGVCSFSGALRKAKSEHTERENEVLCRFSWVYAKQAQHNLYQRMRVRKIPSRLSLFVKDLEPGVCATFCFLIV